MQHLESCLLCLVFTLTVEADRVLYQLADVFNRLFPLDVQKEIQLLSGVMASLFIGFLVEKYATCQSQYVTCQIRFRMALFSFFTFLDA